VGNKDRAGFDNIQFASADTLLIVEDVGDKLHSQRKFLDNGYALDLTQDYSKGGGTGLLPGRSGRCFSHD
jgi:hypothetical protein